MAATSTGCSANRRPCSRSQRPREALPLLETARRRAPEYEDVWRANVNALDQLDEFGAADALLADAAAQFPQSTWPRERQAALPSAACWSAARGFRRRQLRGTLRRPVRVEGRLAGHQPSSWRAPYVFAGLHLEERFDTRDEQLLVAWSGRLDDDWSYGFSGDLSPDAEVLPEWSVAAEAGRALPHAWGMGLRLRHASYVSVDVDTSRALVEKYLDAFSIGYTLNTAKTSDIDDPSFGHLLRVAREYGDASRVALVVGFGEEAETVAPGVVQVTDTKSVALAACTGPTPPGGSPGRPAGTSRGISTTGSGCDLDSSTGSELDRHARLAQRRGRGAGRGGAAAAVAPGAALLPARGAPQRARDRHLAAAAHACRAGGG